MDKPCDLCLVLSSCSHVCDDFLQWCIDTKKINLKCHPNWSTAFITAEQINWVNEKMKTYTHESVNDLIPY